MASPREETTLAGAGLKAKSSFEAALESTRRLEDRQRKSGKTTRVKVVAVERGYDNVRLRAPGERFQVNTAPDDPLPAWVVPETEWTARFESLLPEDYEGDPLKDEILIEECAASLWRERQEAADKQYAIDRAKLAMTSTTADARR